MLGNYRPDDLSPAVRKKEIPSEAEGPTTSLSLFVIITFLVGLLWIMLVFDGILVFFPYMLFLTCFPVVLPRTMDATCKGV